MKKIVLVACAILIMAALIASYGFYSFSSK